MIINVSSNQTQLDIYQMSGFFFKAIICYSRFYAFFLIFRPWQSIMHRNKKKHEFCLDSSYVQSPNDRNLNHSLQFSRPYGILYCQHDVAEKVYFHTILIITGLHSTNGWTCTVFVKIYTELYNCLVIEVNKLLHGCSIAMFF